MIYCEKHKYQTFTVEIIWASNLISHVKKFMRNLVSITLVSGEVHMCKGWPELDKGGKISALNV